MDSSLSTDPHAPDIDDSFRGDRWKRAGATDEEIAALAAEHAGLAPDLRYAEATWIDAHSDGDLRDRLVESDPDVHRPGAVVPPPEELARLEREAIKGEWIPGNPITVGNAEFPLYHLANGWVGTRFGDMLEGAHMIAPNIEDLTDEIVHQVSAPIGTAADLDAWQAAKHVADLRRRVASAA